MDLSAIIALLSVQMPWLHSVLVVLGMLVVLGQVWEVITPASTVGSFILKLEASPIIGPILTLLVTFAPIKKL